MPFEKIFRRLSFSSNIIKIPESSKRWDIEKQREKKCWKKRQRKRKKRKAPKVSSNKKGKSIF
jgi:hypothetical protein